MVNFLNEIKTEAGQLPKSPLTNLLRNATGSFVRGYHLEFLTDQDDICETLAQHDIFAHKYGKRIVIKDCESICNLLALVGATQALYKLNDQIALRSVINSSNRRANCDNANITRQINTAAAQVAKLQKIAAAPEFKTLAPELQQTARARLDNPTATYDELAQILNITKSGVVHRLKRVLAF
jgi:DNA-binding protein WhiA